MRHVVSVIDSHTAGEPTRVIAGGAPDLGSGPLSERLKILRDKHDSFRTSIVMEPRGSEVVVGALLCEPTNPNAATGVIFFNDVGYLGMCGHGTIGLVRTLEHLGRIQCGQHIIETPVGEVQVTLHHDSSVSVRNVSSFRYKNAVPVTVPGFGQFTGDIAWGGNWFFLISNFPGLLNLEHRDELVHTAAAIRSALQNGGIYGAGGAVIDHIEFFAEPEDRENSSRNFVLCPGASFDRSPCGTGTSAKMACLAADRKLKPGMEWRQEGFLGTVFRGSIEIEGESIIPTVRGYAWITAESTLIFEDSDPFRWGIRF